MTPCEEKGYKAGDEFVALERCGVFKSGARIRLTEDDGSKHPAFTAIDGSLAHDGSSWAYSNIDDVAPMARIITRTNGQPFATEASARQKLTAKGLQGTHEVVPHEGGYALVPIQRVGGPITLRSGDYVSTEGMTEEQYHAVARAFMAAGFKWYGADNKHKIWEVIAIDETGDIIGANYQDLELSRHLTIDQVLNATNAGTTTPQTEETTMTADPITTLKQARQARDEAEQAYQAAFEAVRNELPGYVLTEVGTDDPLVDGEDMADPTNWREGDVVECVEPGWDLTVGKFYTVKKALTWTNVLLVCDDKDDCPVRDTHKLRFHHRPK